MFSVIGTRSERLLQFQKAAAEVQIRVERGLSTVPRPSQAATSPRTDSRLNELTADKQSLVNDKLDLTQSPSFDRNF